MTIFWWAGISLASFALFAFIFLRQHLRVRAGIVDLSVKRNHPPLLARRFFTKAHDLERVLIDAIYDGAILVARIVYVYAKKFVRFLLSWKHIKALHNTVRGTKEIDSGEQRVPSAYLKDIADHKDQVRNGGIK